MPTLFETQRDSTARFVETVVLPLLVAFGIGLIVGQWSEEKRTAQAQAAVKQARRAVARIEADLGQWRQACEPLLTLPVHSSPMVLAPIAPTNAGERP